ncbi:MAG TPA: hypothetical protein VMX57_09035 [Planctomycetota bacterium]|nr:hypothetical protein [Planctomycetota bacterium]
MEHLGYHLRLSTKDDADDLARLWGKYQPATDLEVDWADTEGCWMMAVAADGLAVAGAIQLFYSRPTAFIDNLLMDPALDHDRRSDLAKALIASAAAFLAGQRAAAVMSQIDPEHDSWVHWCLKRGWRIIAPRLLMTKKVA